MSARTRTIWTFVVTSVALFMAQLDNLVVTTALPVIRQDLHASLSSLEWTVNAYTLTFAVLLLTGASLGELFGRRRMLVIGLSIFTLGSAAAALAPSIDWLIAFRAMQGAGAAIVVPLTLTLLSAAVPIERRGMALGIWGAVAGLAIATGPVVGGAVVSGWSWQTIFWLNVPLGVLLIPIARLRLAESRGPALSLDLPGVVLASGGLFGIVLGVVPDPRATPVHGSLRSGDALMLYTDGLVEAPGRDIDAGTDRLLGEASRLVAAGFRNAATELVREVKAGGGGSDDCALVLIWRT